MNLKCAFNPAKYAKWLEKKIAKETAENEEELAKLPADKTKKMDEGEWDVHEEAEAEFVVAKEFEGSNAMDEEIEEEQGSDDDGALDEESVELLDKAFASLKPT